MFITTHAVVHPDDFAKAKARIQPVDDGHIAVVEIGGWAMQGSSNGDAARTLVEGLRFLADRVEAAHREWLRTKAAEQ